MSNIIVVIVSPLCLLLMMMNLAVITPMAITARWMVEKLQPRLMKNISKAVELLKI
jgi:hypothetical protein